MRFLPELFEKNRAWAEGLKREDPAFFERLCDIQKPNYLWVGCADSRVPANDVVGLLPGELFVHRNVANLVVPDDRNGISVLQYAVEALGVSHIIVCGHYRCGGVQAALNNASLAAPLGDWLDPIRRTRDEHAEELAAMSDDESRWRRLCELNVMAQVRVLRESPIVQAAWNAGRELTVHGWIYDLRDGLLRDLGVSVDGAVSG